MAAAFAVRRMTAADLPVARAWADAEGWNPGTHDGPAFYAADPDGFFLGELDGRPAACVSCVRQGDRLGFLGLYIVRPDLRGRGYGLAVWRAGMAHLAGRCVGLDGVPARVPDYERSGFRLLHHHVRYAGPGGGDWPAGVVDAGTLPFADLLTYDERHVGAARPAFLRAWLDIPGSHAAAVVRNGSITGFGAVRPSSQGFKIGPLFAADPEAADAVFRALLSHAAGATVCVDVPEPAAKPHAAALVGRRGWAELFRCARMYTGEPPPIPWAEVYGVTSLEVG